MLDLATTYLADRARLDVTMDYLRHEGRKRDGPMFQVPLLDVAGRTSLAHRCVLGALRKALATGGPVEDELEALPLADRWTLFDAVSYGCLRKELVNCVGHPEFDWHLELVPLGDLVFDSRVGPLASSPLERTPFRVAVELLQSAQGGDEDIHQLSDPLIGRQLGGGVLIHDGNGRLLSCAYQVRSGRLDVDTRIDAWVGRPRLPAAADCSHYAIAGRSVFLRPGTPSG